MTQPNLIQSRRARSAIEPRALTRSDAAAYCGLTPRGLDQWIKQGIVPGPIPRTHRWDKRALDVALDKISGLSATVTASVLTEDEETPEDALEAWVRNREKRSEGHSSR